MHGMWGIGGPLGGIGMEYLPPEQLPNESLQIPDIVVHACMHARRTDNQREAEELSVSSYSGAPCMHACIHLGL